jgi:hypothetical protein
VFKFGKAESRNNEIRLRAPEPIAIEGANYNLAVVLTERKLTEIKLTPVAPNSINLNGLDIVQNATTEQCERRFNQMLKFVRTTYGDPDAVPKIIKVPNMNLSSRATFGFRDGNEIRILALYSSTPRGGLCSGDIYFRQKKNDPRSPAPSTKSNPITKSSRTTSPARPSAPARNRVPSGRAE